MPDLLHLRGDTSAGWAFCDPVLADKEPAVEWVGNGLARMKIGDGVTRYLSLPYLQADTDIFATKSYVTDITGGLTQRITDLESAVAALQTP